MHKGVPVLKVHDDVTFDIQYSEAVVRLLGDNKFLYTARIVWKTYFTESRDC
jgi:hypothetical protein